MADGKPGRRKLANDIKKSRSLKIMLNKLDEEKLQTCVDYYKTTKAAILMAGLDLMYDDIPSENKKDNG